jgi:hypothetical protein
MSVCDCLMQVMVWKEFVVCIVSSVQHDMWANLSTLCFYGFLAMAKLVEGLMVESKEGAQKGEDKRLDVVRV